MVGASSRTFMAFSTPPVIGTARLASKAAVIFGAITATVLPLPTPRRVNAEARRWQRSRVSAQVKRRSPSITEVRVGKTAAVLARNEIGVIGT